ncbi:Hypothetical protein I595_549 [Croceitalea dokdonensis DOKDO 023]|uniref:Secreted protein n=1 Tax=Croceitalea dokdonensis DOKDO 023 TaxID=1300341 RepID=A0A0P7AXU6_9FLAO|nr:hypothetical protein [Croceitalea dokdonensis]KPM33645.1 Hypothetical protein I595_549 [Croceitalea dokdonensis DOKDO 023]
MKKVVSIVAVAVMTLGFFSCTNDTAAEDEQLYINASDDDMTDNSRD